MTEIGLRLGSVTHADLNFIARVEAESYHRDLVTSLKGFEGILAAGGERGELFVIHAGDSPAGFVHLDFRLTPGTCTLCDLAIDPKFRRQGLARFALESLIKLAEDRRATRVELYVPQNNTAAVNLYKQFGFTTAKVLKAYYPGGQDGWAMALSL